jgi:hypothetical protein
MSKRMPQTPPRRPDAVHRTDTYDRAKRRVLATPRLRDEFEPPHIDTAGFVFLSHRRRRGDIVRDVVDVRSFSMSCDVLGTAGEVIPTLRVGNQTT